jgi:hypothetical protein
MANGRARCGGPFPLKCVAELPAVALDDEHHHVDRPAVCQLEHVTEASHPREPTPYEERSTIEVAKLGPSCSAQEVLSRVDQKDRHLDQRDGARRLT